MREIYLADWISQTTKEEIISKDVVTTKQSIQKHIIDRYGISRAIRYLPKNKQALVSEKNIKEIRYKQLLGTTNN